MELQTKKTGNALVVSARGRLDANWSDYFKDAFLGYIRQGEHELVVDAKELHFLSSAGIRSLIMINKELARVEGKFIIIKANEFVRSTLETTGLGSWLMKEVTDTAFDENLSNNEQAVSGNYFKLREGAFMQLNCENTWKPWEAVKEDQVKKISFKPDSYALGIGSPISGEVTSGVKFGEYLAVGGNLVYQPPEERSHPDYLLPLENFTPALLSIQSLLCQGEMAHLLRFAPKGDKTSCGIGELVAQALQLCDSDMVAFTILAEIDGLVGAVMIKSPSEIKTALYPAYPDIRDWISFCGEPLFSGEEALIFGVAVNDATTAGKELLSQLPSRPAIAVHMHAVVFPHQPLQNGKLELRQQINKFFNGPPPKALMHLIEDNRPVRGLGESTFIRGAMWCSPIKNTEEAL